MSTDIPDWLQGQSPRRPVARTPSTSLTPEQRNLEIQTFKIAFEFALLSMADGTPFEVFCRTFSSHLPDHLQPTLGLPPGRFRAWIFRDERRRNAYYAAKALAAEAVEDELIRIADGVGPDGEPLLEDNQRSALKIETRKWLLKIWNRRRYGDVKQIEQHLTSNADMSQLSTQELHRRILESLGMDAIEVADIVEDNNADPDPAN